MHLGCCQCCVQFLYFTQTLAQVTPKPTEAKMQVAKQHMNKNRSSDFLPRKQTNYC